MGADRISDKQVKYLFTQYVSGNATNEEKQAFYLIVDDASFRPVLLPLMDDYFRQVSSNDGLNATQKQRILQEVFKQGKLVQTSSISKMRISFRNRYFWFKAVAIVLLFIIIISIPHYLSNPKNMAVVQYRQYEGVILPGGNKATLTLADGRQVSLTDAPNGDLAEQATCQIKKTTNGQILYTVGQGSTNQTHPLQYNTVTVPMGGQYQVVLADGTKVWLNAASSLKFPVSFNGMSERKVVLTGEAYFEVNKILDGNQRVPFIVKSQGQEVKVLGTHFNINAYGGTKMTMTTLLEGKVVVRRSGSFERVLSPGQQARVTNNIRIARVDTSFAVAWKNGLFKFKDANIKTVMDQFAKWYDLDVEYQGAIPSNKFNGEIYRNMSATKALEILRLADIHFSVLAPNSNLGRKKIIIQ